VNTAPARFGGSQAWDRRGTILQRNHSFEGNGTGAKDSRSDRAASYLVADPGTTIEDVGNRPERDQCAVRDGNPRWGGAHREAACREEGAPSDAAVGNNFAAAIQRPPDRARAGLLRTGRHAESGRDRLEARRCALRSR